MKEECSTQNQSSPQILKQVDAAQLFGVSDRTVRNWIKTGRLKKMDLPGCWISRVEIERFLKANGVSE